MGAPTRPAVVSKRTEVRKRINSFAAPEIQAPKRTFDKVLIGLGYLGLASYIYTNPRKLSPWELTGLSLTSMSVGFGMWDLGRRNGRMEGASLALKDPPFSHLERTRSYNGPTERSFDREDYEDLPAPEKIAWLRREEEGLKELQEAEEARCGQAYIVKEEAYKKYERIGAYGGEDWKMYSAADKTCQDMYNAHLNQRKRLRQIETEIKELSTQV